MLLRHCPVSQGRSVIWPHIRVYAERASTENEALHNLRFVLGPHELHRDDLDALSTWLGGVVERWKLAEAKYQASCEGKGPKEKVIVMVMVTPEWMEKVK